MKSQKLQNHMNHFAYNGWTFCSSRKSNPDEATANKNTNILFNEYIASSIKEFDDYASENNPSTDSIIRKVKEILLRVPGYNEYAHLGNLVTYLIDIMVQLNPTTVPYVMLTIMKCPTQDGLSLGMSGEQ